MYYLQRNPQKFLLADAVCLLENNFEWFFFFTKKDKNKRVKSLFALILRGLLQLSPAGLQS